MLPPATTDPRLPTRTNRVLTVPNFLTLARLACLPLFLYLLFGRHDRGQAALLLAVLGATDWCDGYIARHFDQQSDLGKVLDPTADRLLFLVGVGGIVADGSAPLWFCALVLGREVVVATITVVITALGAKPVDVTWFGKAGTFLLMFAFPWFLAGESTLSLAPLYGALAWVVGIPGILISYYAAFRYVPQWREGVRQARALRQAPAGAPARSGDVPSPSES